MRNRLQQFTSTLLACRLWLTVFFYLPACVTSKRTIVKHENTCIELNSSVSSGEDSMMNVEIAPYKSHLSKIMNEILAVSEQNLFKENPEGLLGDFTADIILKKAREYCDSCKIDFCVLNNSSLQNHFPKGNITRGNVFQVLPYENEMVLLTLSGNKVKEFLDFTANKGGIPVSGLRMKIKNNMPADVMIGDEKFNPSRTYSIVVPDYLANGGDNMAFFTHPIRKVILEKKLRDAVIEYLQEETKNGNTIKVKLDERIRSDK